jgi:hypothetical protein
MVPGSARNWIAVNPDEKFSYGTNSFSENALQPANFGTQTLFLPQASRTRCDQFVRHTFARGARCNLNHKCGGALSRANNHH